MIEVKIPAVGESISEVVIAQWLKNDGDYVEMDEVICELESDKATFELNAEASGVLQHKAKEGDTLQIGELVCTIDETASAGAGGAQVHATVEEVAISGASETTTPDKTGKLIEMHVPAVGESITEVSISTWLKKDGDQVELDEVIAEIESDKATFELTAEAEGILSIVAKEGDTLNIGDLICRIEETVTTPKAEPVATTTTTEYQAEQPATVTNYASGHPSPAASKIMAEKGITADQVKGTGKDGRITKSDALKTEKPAAPASEKVVQPISTDLSLNGRNDERKRMSQLRKTIAKRLVAAKNETAMLTTFNEVDMKPIMDIRKKYKDMFKEKYEVGLGFMSFFTKAACMALKEWPAVNAKIDGDEVIYPNYVDVSIAVSTPRGLVVPVIRDADQLSFDQIEKKIIELAVKARDNKLSIEEMTGGTFTITNGGIFGSMLSTPIINAPQSGILGMHNIVERPIVVNGEIVVRPIMYVALSYDHRIIDGRESVSFLVRVKQLLEDPTRLLLGV